MAAPARARDRAETQRHQARDAQADLRAPACVCMLRHNHIMYTYSRTDARVRRERCCAPIQIINKFCRRACVHAEQVFSPPSTQNTHVTYIMNGPGISVACTYTHFRALRVAGRLSACVVNIYCGRSRNNIDEMRPTRNARHAARHSFDNK